MRKAIGVAVIFFAASIALAATGKIQPLKARTGLWQITKTFTWTLPPNLPPQYATFFQSGVPEQYKSCVRSKDLSSNPWADGSGTKCTWTVLRSTGTDMDVEGSCDSGQEGSMSMTMEGRGRIHIIDSENGTGTEDFILTRNGMTVKGHATYTGKWISATCPGQMN